MKAKFLILVVLIFPSITNSQIIKMEMTEIIDRSDLIIYGKVVKTETKWHEDERGKHIYTYADVTIVQKLKGKYKEKNIKLEAMGGKVGEEWEYVTDSYTYEEGEEFILFLDAKSKLPIGSHQGKLEVFGEKIYIENRGIKATNFKNKIKDYVLNPTEGFILSENDFITDEIPNPPKQKENTIDPQVPINLVIDPNSLRQDAQITTQQGPIHLVIDPNSSLQSQEIDLPQEHKKLELDTNRPIQNQEIDEVQELKKLELDTNSSLQSQEIDLPQEHKKLELDTNRPIQNQEIDELQELKKLELDPNSSLQSQEIDLPQEHKKLEIFKGKNNTKGGVK